MEETWQILERVKARQKAMESLCAYLNELESQLSLLFTYSPDLIILSKDNGEIIKVNAAVKDILGFSPNEMKGKSILDFIVESDIEKTKDFILSLIREKTKFSIIVKNDIYFTNHWKKKDGNCARLVWRYSFFDKQNNWIIKFGTDFTKLPVENPLIAEFVLKSIANSTTGFIITNNLINNNPIIYANDAFCKASGFEREEILGKNCRFLNQKDRNQKALIRLKHVIREGKSGSFLVKNFRKDGKAWFNHVTIDPIIEDGKVSKFIGASRDVTELVINGEIIWDRESATGFGKIKNESIIL